MAKILRRWILLSLTLGIPAFPCRVWAQEAPLELPWVTAAVRAPRVQFRLFDSLAAHAKVSYHIYTPEVYDAEPQRRFPVLYWLHGTGGGLRGIATLAAQFNAAIRAGQAPPMLVVFANGLPHGMWCDAQDGRQPVETVVVKELLPHIDSAFRTLATREGRLVEGFSMGGYGAARLGLKHPHLFGAISVLAGGPFDWELRGPRTVAKPEERAELLRTVFGDDLEYFRAQSPLTWAEHYARSAQPPLLIRHVVGDRDDTFALNRDFHQRLTQLKIAHAFIALPGVGHDPRAVFEGLGQQNWEFYRQAFAATPALHR